jgi:hypothetical protein
MRAILILPAGAGRLPMEALTSGASALLLRLGAGDDAAARAGDPCPSRRRSGP